MKEHPILFSAPMVRAILAGTKTQTRRVMVPQPQHLQVHKHRGKVLYDGEHRMWCWKDVIVDNIWDFPLGGDRKTLAAACPYGLPGDRLWVRETWGLGGDRLMDPCLNYLADGTQRPVNRHKRGDDLWYPYGSEQPITSEDLLKPSLLNASWRPSIHMPRWASRITLEITGVRVERVQEISEADAYAEGCNDDGHPYISPFGGRAVLNNYAALWNQINGKRPDCAWADNPWVWVVEFKRVA